MPNRIARLTPHSSMRRELLQAGAFGAIGIAAADVLPSYGLAADTCVQSVPGTGLSYYLVAFDKTGNELKWSDGRRCSEKAIARIRESGITDVFIFSHGWMGDVEQAKSQYENWIGAMAACRADIDAMRRIRPGFSPLLIGIHWPSLPFGDERLVAAAAAAVSPKLTGQLDKIADTIADTPRAKQALQTILSAAQDPAPARLPARVVEAFNVLPREAGLQNRGPAARPGADAARFDPATLYNELQFDRGLQVSAAEASGGPVLNYNLLYILALVSFWTMKDRARVIGETGGHQLLSNLQAAARNQDVRFHLMGHSFGCIVVSATLQGPPGSGSRLQPVSSLALVQGALSHWSYCSTVYGTGSPGYFRSVVGSGRVSGPIVTTQSDFDTAVGTLYPYAAEFRGQRAMATLNAPTFPEYGAVGHFGIQGQDCNPSALDILNVTQPYGFRSGLIYNINCSRVIAKMYPLSGAHSDISHPEVAHAVWEAARVSVPTPQPAPAPSPSPSPSPRPGGPLRRLFRRG